MDWDNKNDQRHTIMQNSNSEIQLLFLWIIGILLMGHTLLPHQHHYDAIVSHCDIAGDNLHDEADNKKLPKYHCHAFNELIQGNSRQSLPIKAIFQIADITDLSSHNVLGANGSPELVYIPLHVRAKNIHLFYPYVLRGPPIIS